MQLAIEANERDHISGELSAPVVLLHYGDFECPFSAAAHPVVRNLQERMGDKLCVVFRAFPLDDIHPNALQAALAAEAAGNQGQFWPTHDLLFQNQDSLQPEDLASYAGQLGLDAEKFERDLQSDDLLNRVRTSIEGGRSSGVHGTPTFWINGEFHDNREGLWKPAHMIQAIEEALA